jgi:hypothetical protein
MVSSLFPILRMQHEKIAEPSRRYGPFARHHLIVMTSVPAIPMAILKWEIVAAPPHE